MTVIYKDVKTLVESQTLFGHGAKALVMYDTSTGEASGLDVEVLINMDASIAEKADTTQVEALDAEKLDIANVYNGLDKTVEGFALDARKGKALDDGKIDKAAVKQATGSSETDVMSQKSVSELYSSNLGFDETIQHEESFAIKTTAYESGKILFSDGSLVVNAGYSVSDYISLDNITYSYALKFKTEINASYGLFALYDANKNPLLVYIGGSGTVIPNKLTPLSRINQLTKYIRFSIETATIGSYGLYYTSKAYFTESILKKSINLFQKEKIQSGKFIDLNGNLSSNASTFVTDYIDVTVGLTYRCNNDAGTGGKIALYDANKTLIVESITNSSERQITASSSAKYVRFSALLSAINTTMVVEGNLPATFVDYAINGKQIGYNVNKLRWAEPLQCVFTDKDLTRIETTFTVGYIFELANSGFSTSDYIPIKDKFNKYIIYLSQIFSSAYSLIRFYDKDYNVVLDVKGGTENTAGLSIINRHLALRIPDNCEYIKYARGNSQSEVDSVGIFILNNIISFQGAVNNIVNKAFTATRNVLWIGTSIPAGAQYPSVSCQSNGYMCINKAVGSSQMIFTNIHPETVYYYSGRNLTATVAELESLYRADVTSGVITEAQLEEWKNGSYERSVIPYINGVNAEQASLIVLDHGFNDRQNIHSLILNESGIDWESRDRSNFVGAFNYLIDKIFTTNKFVKIIIGGYFQNQYEDYFSSDICRMQELLSQKYEIKILKIWEESGFSAQHVAGSSEYISDYNSEHGTVYQKINPDVDGNIMFLQLFCPDGVHPHSDLTGSANIRLNAIYTRLLSRII